jgi:hypothetical protein
MKNRSLLGAFGLALVIGTLAATPAFAASGLIKVTHSDTPYKGWAPRETVTAKAQPTVSHPASAKEVQVAVMANGKAQVAPRRSIFIHR